MYSGTEWLEEDSRGPSHGRAARYDRDSVRCSCMLTGKIQVKLVMVKFKKYMIDADRRF